MGYCIRKIRESVAMTQAQLAEKSGVSRTTISALERGTVTTTTTKTLMRIAKALGVPLDKIFFADNV